MLFLPLPAATTQPPPPPCFLGIAVTATTLQHKTTTRRRLSTPPPPQPKTLDTYCRRRLFAATAAYTTSTTVATAHVRCSRRLQILKIPATNALHRAAYSDHRHGLLVYLNPRHHPWVAPFAKAPPRKLFCSGRPWSCPRYATPWCLACLMALMALMLRRPPLLKLKIITRRR
jgi:hypothetical protein